MDRHEFSMQLQGIASDYLSQRGLELVEVICRYEGRDLCLRILVDRPEGGISVGECASVNSDLSRILEKTDTLGERYILEVSSPGIDRPLMTRSDFSRSMGKTAVFYLNDSILGRFELEGVISSVGDNAVVIDRGHDTVEIPFDKIRKAKQILTSSLDGRKK